MISIDILKAIALRIIIVVFSMFVSFHTAEGKEDFVLIIDAGHGGRDSGAIGKKSKEKEITLAIALLTGKYITEHCPNVKVIYTRDKDEFIDLWKRTDIANKIKANLFISIHANASTDTHVRGLELYTFGKSKTKENLEETKRKDSVLLAEKKCKDKCDDVLFRTSESYIIFESTKNKFICQSINFAFVLQEELKSCVHCIERGIKQDEYFVLRKANMPRVLIELDFITNSEAEIYLLSETGQEKYARAICNAFLKYNLNNSCYSDSTIVEHFEEKILDNKTSSLEKKSTKDETVGDNTIYKVQIFASSNKLPNNSPKFKGYQIDSYEEDNFYKYTYGSSSSFKEILQIRKKLLGMFEDAFIVCFKNGIRVKLNQ